MARVLIPVKPEDIKTYHATELRTSDEDWAMASALSVLMGGQPIVLSEAAKAEHDGLCLDAIRNPDDDAPRLIYSDWLADHGIRSYHDETERKEVTFATGGLNLKAWSRLGFIEAIECTFQQWLDHGPALVARSPLLEVKISDKAPWSTFGVWRWWVGRELQNGETYDIPHGMMLPTGDADYWAIHASEDEAHAALSRAFLEWARSVKPKAKRRKAK